MSTKILIKNILLNGLEQNACLKLDALIYLWVKNRTGLDQSRRTGACPWTSKVTPNGFATSIMLIIINVLIK